MAATNTADHIEEIAAQIVQAQALCRQLLARATVIDRAVHDQANQPDVEWDWRRRSA